MRTNPTTTKALSWFLPLLAKQKRRLPPKKVDKCTNYALTDDESRPSGRFFLLRFCGGVHIRLPKIEKNYIIIDKLENGGGGKGAQIRYKDVTVAEGTQRIFRTPLALGIRRDGLTVAAGSLGLPLG